MLRKEVRRFKDTSHRPAKNGRLPDEAQFRSFNYVGFPVNLGFVSNAADARIMSHAGKSTLDALVTLDANDQKKL